MATADDERSAATAYRSSPPTAHQWSPQPHVYPHSHHGTPAQEYTGFNFQQSPQLSMEPSAYNAAFQRPVPQQLQPLIMPQWPSMLSSQSHSSYQPVYHQPMHQSIQPMQPIGMGSLPTPVSAVSSRSASTPRKTLTDLDRKKMCLYAEANPNSKQTEIGAIFGVERSTVSKVLRQKEKYLYQDDGSRSPVKRAKGRSPDIDKTLAKWAIKQERSGLSLTDDLIREKARYFAAATTNPDGQGSLTLSASWLEKFKLKNNLMGARSRKASLANTDDGEMTTSLSSSSHARGDVSPTSSPQHGVRSPSPTELTSVRSQENMKNESPDSYTAFRHPFHSDSRTSISTAFTDTAPSSFSPGPLSPTSPFFTPDSGTAPSPFVGLPVSRPVQQAPLNSGSIRPRSQTFPLLDQYMVTTAESMTPKYILDNTVLDSPMEEPADPIGGIDETVAGATAPHLSGLDDRCNTVTPLDTMRPPPLPARLSHPDLKREATPTTSPEEARRALEVVLSYFEQQPSGFLDFQESVTMGKLMEKLKLQHRNSLGG